MQVITLKDYAKQKNVSYEAVRKQVARYKKELDQHIIIDGRQQFLDEEAVAFLDAKRQKNPVAIIQQDKDETIEALRREREQLLAKVAAQAEELRAADKALVEVNQLLLSAAADKARAEELEVVNEHLKADMDTLKAEKTEIDLKAADAVKEAEKANMELSEVSKMGIFAFLRWKKSK